MLRWLLLQIIGQLSVGRQPLSTHWYGVGEEMWAGGQDDQGGDGDGQEEDQQQDAVKNQRYLEHLMVKNG